MAKRLSLVFAALSLCVPAWSQAGPQMATFHSAVDDSDQPYAIYVPKPLDPVRKYPLVIALHSEDSNHRITLRRTLGLPPRLGEFEGADLRNFPPAPDIHFIVACPLARGSIGFRGIPERDVYDVLADVERRYHVDPDRVYLTGASMGGAGALRLALTRPDIWAAVAVVCPTPIPDIASLAPNALNLPVRLYQGELDPVVPASGTRDWHRRLLDAGAPAEYIEYPGVRHNAWDLAYRDHAVLDWFDQHRRNFHPAHIRFTTDAYRYSTAYWLRIDGLTPGTQASFGGAWSGGALEVITQNMDGFTVETPVPRPRPPALITVTIDHVPLRVRSAGTLSFVKSGGGWRAGRYTPAGKRPGAEGPIAEAVAGRHLYVYGTGGADIAARAADWSVPTSHVSLKLPVKADSAVTAADLATSDLVLFGNAETNSVIARLAAKLPFALHAGAADYGLVFIAPVGAHYVLVNSGLPWWTGADESRRGGDPFAPERRRLLTTFGDYILFRGSVANVVAEGRFDRNWKLPPDAAARMLATGTITINNQ